MGPGELTLDPDAVGDAATRLAAVADDLAVAAAALRATRLGGWIGDRAAPQRAALAETGALLAERLGTAAADTSRHADALAAACAALTEADAAAATELARRR